MTDSPTTANGQPSSVSAQRVVQTIAHRGMAPPALVFLASHRPLAFVAGQALYAVQPLAELFNIRACAELAAVLSAPDGLASLERALAEADAAFTGDHAMTDV